MRASLAAPRRAGRWTRVRACLGRLASRRIFGGHDGPITKRISQAAASAANDQATAQEQLTAEGYPRAASRLSEQTVRELGLRPVWLGRDQAYKPIIDRSRADLRRRAAARKDLARTGGGPRGEGGRRFPQSRGGVAFPHPASCVAGYVRDGAIIRHLCNMEKIG